MAWPWNLNNSCTTPGIVKNSSNIKLSLEASHSISLKAMLPLQISSSPSASINYRQE
jgi:hypothetical protein